jgi:Ni,Fe-hydrogenase I small subunit
MIKAGSTCFVCCEPLHPNWWSSWGFRELDENLKKLAKELNLQDLRRATLENIRSTAQVSLISSFFFLNSSSKHAAGISSHCLQALLLMFYC